MKSSNITPERGNVETYLGNRVVSQRPQENGVSIRKKIEDGMNVHTLIYLFLFFHLKISSVIEIFVLKFIQNFVIVQL